MGQLRQVMPVKMIVSAFTGEVALWPEVRAALVDQFGAVDYESEWLAFDLTRYYVKEFGEKLQRKIVAFSDLAPPDMLATAKRTTNELELRWRSERGRRANLDAGYVTLAKLVLATTKDYAHRIYIGSGIYAEVTLRYQGGEFQPWPWTYPDYASPRYREILAEIRHLYLQQMQHRQDAVG